MADRRCETPWEQYRREMRELNICLGIAFAFCMGLMFLGFKDQAEFERKCTAAGGAVLFLKSESVCVKPDTLITLKP